jgi:hypothetical protein
MMMAGRLHATTTSTGPCTRTTSTTAAHVRSTAGTSAAYSNSAATHPGPATLNCNTTPLTATDADGPSRWRHEKPIAGPRPSPKTRRLSLWTTTARCGPCAKDPGSGRAFDAD